MKPTVRSVVVRGATSWETEEYRTSTCSRVVPVAVTAPHGGTRP